MQFATPDQSFVKQAVHLAAREYKEEAARNRQLPQEPDLVQLEVLISQLFAQRYALAAFEDRQLVGYLAFWPPIKEQFGRVKGVFSPLHGSAFAGTDRKKTAALLYQHLAEDFVNQQIISFAICKYAHDREILSTFVLSGFGIRCSDAIRDLKQPLTLPPLKDFRFCQLHGEDKKAIAPLQQKLIRHLGQSPTFLYKNSGSHSTDESKRVFAVYQGSQAVAYMETTFGGETFVSETPGTLHICGAYCLPEYRGSGVSGALLAFITNQLEQEGISHLGVDCETLNPNALHFWGKYFDAYTYSLVRRLDERLFDHPQLHCHCSSTERT